MEVPAFEMALIFGAILIKIKVFRRKNKAKAFFAIACREYLGP